MKLTGDFHTHSIFSKFRHGKNTIQENYEAARDLGFSGYGVSDHGPKHIFYGIRKKNFKVARAIVDEINKDGKKPKLYLGIEANLIGGDGRIDVNDDQIKHLDYLVVGYHKGTITDFVQYFFAKKSPKQIKKNTDAYINAIKKYKVAFISHPNTYIRVDAKRLAEACAETNTLIEINNRHFNFSREEVEQMLETNVKFIVSSDAHRAERIGNVAHALDMINEYNIPIDRIVNIDKDYVPKACN